MNFLLIIFNVLLLVGGQVFWKLAVIDVKHWDISQFISVVISPFFLIGSFLYVVATGLWLVILSKVPLSIAYPFQSISYIFGAIFAFFLFKEAITLQQCIGFLVILGGVYLISN
jgi:drug/metabolite transporter (DMT)-like permease